MQRPALTRRTLLLAVLAPFPAAAISAVPSWPECARKPRCRWEQVSRTQDLTRCVPPPRNRAGQVLTHGGPCWLPEVATWRCTVCGKMEATVE